MSELKGLRYSGLSIFLLFATSLHADEDHFLQVNAVLNGGLDYNVGNADKSRDKVADHFLDLQFAIAHDFFITEYQAINLELSAKQRSHKDIEGLNHWGGGAKLTYLWQPGSGFFSPLLQLNGSIESHEYDWEQRSNTQTKGQFIVVQRITDHMSGHVGVEYQQQDSDGTVFDLEQRRAFLGLDYLWTPHLISYGSASFITGEISSTTMVRFCNGSQAPDIFYLIQAAKALEMDHTFNDQFCGNWVAYKLDADTQVGTLGLNYSFGDGWAFDVAATYAVSDITPQISYERPIFNISLFKGF